MDRETKNNLYKCDPKGLIELMNDPRYVNDKNLQFNAVVGYLARFEMQGGKSKGEFKDLLNLAKNEFLAQAAKKHADSKDPLPYDSLGKNDARVKAFVLNPSKAIEQEFVNLSRQKTNLENEQDGDVIEYYRRIKVNAEIQSIQLHIEAKDGFAEHRPYDAALSDVMNRLTKKIPEGQPTPEDALNKVNSGIFGKLFRRPSKEFKAFKEAFDQFRDAGKVENKGNVANLESKTTAYIKHHIPNFQYAKDMPKEEMLQRLPKDVRGRIGFAFNVLDSIAEHKEMKPYLDNVDNAINGKPVKEVEKPVVQAEDNQIDFQKEVELKVEEPKVEVAKEEVKEEPNTIEINNELAN